VSGPEGVDISRDDLMADVERMKRYKDALIEHTRVIAEIKKAQYDSFVEAGFSEQQAFFLLKRGLEL